MLQPLVVATLAVRAGFKDANAGRSAFGWALATDAVNRRELLRQYWKDVAKVFVAAVIVDLIYEVIVFRWIYPGQSLLVATIVALLPYPFIRGSVNRVVRLWRERREITTIKPVLKGKGS